MASNWRAEELTDERLVAGLNYLRKFFPHNDKEVFIKIAQICRAHKMRRGLFTDVIVYTVENHPYPQLTIKAFRQYIYDSQIKQGGNQR